MSSSIRLSSAEIGQPTAQAFLATIPIEFPEIAPLKVGQAAREEGSVDYVTVESTDSLIDMLVKAVDDLLRESKMLFLECATYGGETMVAYAEESGLAEVEELKKAVREVREADRLEDLLEMDWIFDVLYLVGERWENEVAMAGKASHDEGRPVVAEETDKEMEEVEEKRLGGN